MNETAKIVTLSILTVGILATALGFATVQPILAATIPATLWAIAAIVRAIRGDRDVGQDREPLEIPDRDAEGVRGDGGCV
jgi:hypothetical protein